MANSDRDIVIVPDRGASTHPAIYFTGADSLSSATIVLRVYNSGTDATLSFEGDSGQIFSLTDSVLGPVFSVNDVTGIPSIEVFDSGEIRLAEYNGYVNVAGTENATSTQTGVLRVAGGVGIARDAYVGGNLTVVGTLLAGSGGITGTASTATTVAITNDPSNASVQYVTFVSATSGNQGIKVDSNSLAYVPSTNSLGLGTTSPYGRLSIVGGAATEGLALFTSGYEPSRQWGTRIFKNDIGGGIPLQIDTQYASTWYTTIRMSHGQDNNHPALITYYNTQLAMNSGNVGVGIVPTNKLHVSGTTKLAGSNVGVRLYESGDDFRLDFVKAANDTASARIEWNGYSSASTHRVDYLSFQLNDSGGTMQTRLHIVEDGRVGISTTDFSYATGDNTRLVGSYTNNRLFVNGSIQLLGNNDAIVIGRGTATFLTDEELGFGWGGGWWMNDATYLRVRNYKHVYNENIFSGSKFQGYSTSYNQPSMFQVRWNDSNWAFGSSSNDSSIFWMQAQYFGNNDNNRGFRVLDTNSSVVRMAVADKITTHQNTFYRTFQNYTGTENNPVKTWDGVLAAGSDSSGANTYTIIETNVPQDSYMMGGFTIQWFENYGSTNGKTLINLSGYWNPESNGGFVGWEYTSSNPNITPTIQVGRNTANGKTVFVLTHFNSSYAIIIARDLWLGYSGGDYDYGHGWSVSQVGSLAAYSNLDTVVPRTLSSGSGGSGSGINADLLDSLDSTDFMRNFGMINNTDQYVNFRVMRNSNSSSSNDGMYIGYGNTNSGLTRIFGGGATSGQLEKHSTYTLEPGSFRAPIFYDSNNTGYYLDPTSTTTSLNMAGSVRQATYNKPGILSVASGSASTGGSLAIQQETAEGWTGIFVDYEPYTGWGLWHDNPNNYFSFTSEASTGSIRSFSVPSRVSGNRTAYEKFRVDQNNGDIIVGRDGYANTSFRAPIFYDSNDTSYYVDPNSGSLLRGRVNVTGGHGSSSIRNYLAASENGASTGIVTLQMWCSEPGNTWDGAGFGYNVDNNLNESGNVPAYYFGRPNTSFGQAYMRMTTDGNWYFYNTPNGSNTRYTTLQLERTGYVLANQSIRAPIFYDSNNTSYYADPAGTSVFNILNVNSINIPGSGGGNSREYVFSCSASATQARRFEIARIAIDYNDWNSVGGFEVELHETYFGSGLVKKYTVYYGYTSNFGVQLTHFSGSGSNNFQVTTSGEVVVAGDQRYISVYVDVRYYSQVTAIVRTTRTVTTSNPPGIGNTFIFTTPTITNITDFTADSIVFIPTTVRSSADFRAPIFYDNDDTNYYLDPNSTSDTALRIRGGALHGPNVSWGDYLLVGGNGRQNYTNSTNVASVVTTDGNLHLDAASAHDTYINYYDGTNVYLGNGANAIVAQIANDGTFRSPVFYDYNNTAYYLNPNGTTSLRTVGAWRSDSSTWDGEFAGKIQYHSNSWYHQYQDWFFLRNSGGSNVVQVNSSGYMGLGGTSPTGIMSGTFGLAMYHANNPAIGFGSSLRNWLIYGTTDQSLRVWNNSTSDRIYVFTDHTRFVGDVRAPIYYDSDNTAYYVDPAGTSVLNNVTFNGSFSSSNVIGEFKALPIPTSYDIDRTTKITSGLAIYSGYSSGANRPTTYDISAQFALSSRGFEIAADWIGTDDTALFVRSLRDCCQNWSSWSRILTDDYARASIFYDRDDTNYYLDPNSTTTSLNVRGEIRNPSIWINDGDNFNAYNENIRLFNAPNGVSVIAFSASGVSGTPTTSILGYSDRMERRYQDSWQDRMYNGYVQASGSYRAPIFYDSDNTSYYADFTNGTTSVFQLGNTVYNSYGRGPTGLYASTRLQLVFSMGSSYQLPADGTSAGNLYGIAWSHPNAGSIGGANNLASHGMLILENGAFRGAWGGGRLVTTSDIRGTIFYDYNNTAYYGDFASRRSTNIDGFSSRTKMTLGLTAKYQLDRADYTSDTNYWVGSMGWGTTDLNTVFDWGSGFWDTWGNPSNQPAGTSHWTGFSSMHYTNGSSRYGWQMTMGAGSPSLLYVRGVWGGGFSTWYQVNLLGLNQGSVSNYANIYYDSDDTSYYMDPSNVSNIRYLKLNTSGSSSTTRALTIKAEGQSELNFGAYPGSWTSALQIQNNNNTDIVWISPLDDGQNARFRTGGSGLDFYTDGTVTDTGTYSAFIGSGSTRSPIFYDLNDTSYYVDPNSISNLQYIDSINYADFREANQAINDWEYTGLNINPTANDYNDGSWYIQSTSSDWSRGLLSRRRFRRVEGLTLEFEAFSDTAFTGNCLWMMGFASGTTTNYSYCQTPSNLLYQSNGGTLWYENCSGTSSYNVNTLNQWVKFRVILKSRGAEYFVHWSGAWQRIGSTTSNDASGNEYVRVLVSMYNGRVRFRNMSVFHQPSYYRDFQFYHNVNTRSLGVGLGASGTQGRIDASSQVRAPIYYDSNNTAYYADFSTSGLSLNFLGYSRGGSGSLSTPTFGFVSDTATGMYRYTTNVIGFSAGGNDEFRITTDHTFSPGSSRAPIFYDSDNTGFYLNPNDTSYVNNMYIAGGVAGISNSSSYTEAAIEIRERNFGGAQDDTWATAPRISFHWGGRVASQIGMGSNGRIYIRNNPGTGSEAFESGTFYAPIFYDANDTSYYCDPNSSSTLNYVLTRRVKFIGESGDSGMGTESYAIYQEGGAWTFPYPDLRIGFHTGIKMGANSGYEGIRLYTDYDMSSRVIQFNGPSNYIYADRWINVTGNQGIYSGTNGAHFYPNGGSYGAWKMDGSRGGWRGIEFDSSISLMMNTVGHGFYYNGVGWRFYEENGSGYFPGEVTAYWSDARLKENIVQLPSKAGINLINKLKPSRFNWRKDVQEISSAIVVEPGKEEIGLIAQEVQEVLPDAVKENKAGRSPGADNDKESFLTVNYDKIAPFLIQAVKDLLEEITDLKNEIKDLKEKVNNGSN